MAVDDPTNPAGHPSDNPPSGGGAGNPAQPGESGTYSQQFSHNPVAARVPESVARGVLSTGVLVLESPTEFVLDFLHSLARPAHVASRVILPPMVMGRFIAAVQDNFNRYSQTFGAPPPLPKPPPHRPTLQEIYENFKLADSQLSGVYANAVIVGHSPAEFVLDFVTTFYPHAAVSSRVFLAAPQVPRMLEALTQSYRRFEQRQQPPTPPE